MDFQQFVIRMSRKRWHACLRKEYIILFTLIQLLEIAFIVNLRVPEYRDYGQDSYETTANEPQIKVRSSNTTQFKTLASTSAKYFKGINPTVKITSIEHEHARRKLETTSEEFWYYTRNKLKDLSRHSALTEDVKNSVKAILHTGEEYQRTLTNDFKSLKNVDRLAEWRLNESQALGRLVQNRLRYLQNPTNCDKARKLICKTTICSTGFACQMHHYATCLIIAYATQRTMVVDPGSPRDSYLRDMEPLSQTCTYSHAESFVEWREGVDHIEVIHFNADFIGSYRPGYLPLAVPDDLADRIEHFHGNPSVWWIGQFLAYVFRPKEQILSSLDLNPQFKGPTVGIHVRRTDKITALEAKAHEVDEYMNYVDEWFAAMMLKDPGIKHKVYLATDSVDVITKINETYPHYTIYSNINIASIARPSTRGSDRSRIGIIHDIFLLSRCDYLVCTFSSNVCRMAYALMQTRQGDASKQFKSLDDVYYIDGQNPHLLSVNEPIQGQMNLQVGEKVKMLGNHWDGSSKVESVRDRRIGLVPSYKLSEILVRAKMPTYPNVNEHTYSKEEMLKFDKLKGIS